MFTGIVEAIGQIRRIEPFDLGDYAGLRLTVDAPTLGLDDVKIGDSISIGGACMTVISKTDTAFDVDVSHESLSKTSGLNALGAVNLERAMRLSDRIGGHLVTGHVDGLGRVASFNQVGESYKLQISMSRALGRFFAVKGSITVNGVSLTVNQVTDDAEETTVSINLIPHTLSVTTLGSIKASDQVNLEIDLIARYCARLLAGDDPLSADPLVQTR